MKVRLSAAFLLGVIAMGLTLSALAQGAQQPQTAVPGKILAVRVVGEVSAVRGVDKATVTLKNNDPVTQGDVVVTGANSSVVLVFSNGSTVSLAQNSRLSVDEFLQDPFGQDIKVADLTAEPSTSHTKLSLTYGELVGNVKKLKGDSSYMINTPVGAAGIRGTTFRIVYRPSGTGQAFFSLSTATGEIIFQGTTGTPVPVPANQEVVAEVTINDTTGAVESVQVTTQGISPEAQQVIQQQVTQAVESLDTTTITSPTSGGDNSSGDGSSGNNSSNNTPSETPTPTPPPRTTPGDGTTG